MSNEEKPTSCLGIILHSYMGIISNNHETRILIKQPVPWKARDPGFLSHVAQLGSLDLSMFLTKCLGSESEMFSTMLSRVVFHLGGETSNMFVFSPRNLGKVSI